MRRRLALILAATLVLGVAGCTGDGGENGGVTLPSAAPTLDRPSRTATAQPEQTETEKTEEPERTTEPTRTRETADPEPTEEETTEPERTTDPPQAAEPTRTQPPPPTAETRTETKTVTAEPTPTTASSSAAAVPVSENDDSGGFLPWLLVFLAIGAVIAIVLISRSRRETAWDGEAATLDAETRSVIGVRLPPVLTAQTAGERGLSWPPVRDDLRDLSAHWGVLSQNAPDGERQASASQIAVLLRDLVPAIDAENQALATGREWRMLRPQVDQILDALTAVMQPQPQTYRRNPPPPPAEPYYA
ncbi:hypothetical protein ACTI_40040 [Actinoplanes sp. OR16]|uniref:hypothetical protein n=1 Tax=Actinoplanes sp. OR16 TaxID=946334 RepID=UPI000F6F4B09|nr:hypothetical protein [Actinoplanes sp. OR16]BBH67319.1 hypothetical protein ACTI_40040 [Actinoplanes sp. OR16]